MMLKDRNILLDEINITGKRCVEVGVLAGRYSDEIFKRNPRVLYLIDLWAHQDENIYPNMNLNQSDDRFKEMYKLVRYRFLQYRNVVLIKDLSHNAAQRFKPASIDFVYIDANHAYEAVMQDLVDWWPLIKVGGWFCGHDLTNKEVVEALIKFFGSLDIFDYITEVDPSGSSSWAIRKKQC